AGGTSARGRARGCRRGAPHRSRCPAQGARRRRPGRSAAARRRAVGAAWGSARHARVRRRRLVLRPVSRRFRRADALPRPADPVERGRSVGRRRRGGGDVIRRVDIDNLVIVERASFEPTSGLTAVTGETGAGKTLLTTAIALLFGGEV